MLDYIKSAAEVQAEAEAKAAQRIRVERDRLLSGSDWTQVADAPADRAACAHSDTSDHRFRRHMISHSDVSDHPEMTPSGVVW